MLLFEFAECHGLFYFQAPWSSCIKNMYIGNVASMSVVLYYSVEHTDMFYETFMHSKV